MPVSQTSVPTARTIRVVHLSLVAGLVMFTLVAQFVLRPARAAAEPMLPSLVTVLLALGVAGFVAALVLRRLVPRRGSGEAPDAYWGRASAAAIVSWAPMEFGALLSIFAYSQSGYTPAFAVGVVGMVALFALGPASLERR